jgi:hypothetical protein
MPSVSIAQQRLMAQAYAVKIGELSPSKLNPKYRDEIVKLSKNMTEKELKAFASTKYKNTKKKLPDHVNEEDMPISLEPVSSAGIPKFQPKGPGKIVPYLDTDSKQTKKGKKNLANLKDYRDWLSGK